MEYDHLVFIKHKDILGKYYYLTDKMIFDQNKSLACVFRLTGETPTKYVLNGDKIKLENVALSNFKSNDTYLITNMENKSTPIHFIIDTNDKIGLAIDNDNSLTRKNYINGVGRSFRFYLEEVIIDSGSARNNWYSILFVVFVIILVFVAALTSSSSNRNIRSGGFTTSGRFTTSGGFRTSDGFRMPSVRT